MLLYVHTGDAAAAGSAAYRPPAAEEARGWGDTGPMSISKWLYQATHSSIYLPISAHICPYLPISPHISPYLQVALPGDASPLPPHPCPYQAARNADFEWFDLYSAEAAEPRAPLQDWPEFKRLQAGDIGEI